MNRPEDGISPEACKALINANMRNGNLPQGTAREVIAELTERGLFVTRGLTLKGRAAHGRLVHDALGEL